MFERRGGWEENTRMRVCESETGESESEPESEPEPEWRRRRRGGRETTRGRRASRLVVWPIQQQGG